MLQEIAVEEFEVLVGQTLELERDGHRFALEVAEVHRLRAPSPRPLPPFSVLLRDPAAKHSHTQGMYRIEHPQRGGIDLFVVPLGPDGQGMAYELTFN